MTTAVSGHRLYVILLSIARFKDKLRHHTESAEPLLSYGDLTSFQNGGGDAGEPRWILKMSFLNCRYSSEG